LAVFTWSSTSFLLLSKMWGKINRILISWRNHYRIGRSTISWYIRFWFSFIH
jgi:hypothetical protein